MEEPRSRKVQTTVKHEILTRYLDTWGGIIVGGLTKARKVADWHCVYVDCFSYTGRYLEKPGTTDSDEEKRVDGSPLIGIKALDRLMEHAAEKMGIKIRVNSILIEKKKSTYETLIATLRDCGYGPRIAETRDFSALRNGQIAVINDNATLLADSLVPYTSRPDTWAFYLLDPYGPSGIPYSFVSKIVRQPHHDAMINFIYEDLLRKTGMCLKANPGCREQQLIDYWTEAYGGDSWIELARQTLLNEEVTRDFREVLDGVPLDDMNGMAFTDEELAEVKEQRFVSEYRKVLSSMDRSLVTKLVNLRFGDRNRTIFYLFLTTHDPTGALALNRILYDAKYLERELRFRLRMTKRLAPPPGQLALWGPLPSELKAPAFEKPAREAIHEIGRKIMTRFGGTQATRKDIYAALADTLYFPKEIDQALRYLRKYGQADFDGDLRHNTCINFHRQTVDGPQC